MYDHLRNLLAILALVPLLLFGCKDDSDSIFIPPQDNPGFSGAIQSSGADAVEYLRDTTFTGLAVEIDRMEGTNIGPDSTTTDLLKQRLEERCRKSSVVVNTGTGAPNDEISQNSNLYKQRYTVQDLLNIEAAFRNLQDTSNTKTLYVIALNGESEFDTQNRQVLGLAYTASSIAIFKDNIKDIAGQGAVFASVNEIENSVYVHEAGHNLGLVNNGIGMVTDHEDPDHPHHDQNDSCVMFYEVEVGLLQNTPPTQFDANCIDDVQAAGGK